jgi:hypothetical protein
VDLELVLETREQRSTTVNRTHSPLHFVGIKMAASRR